MGRASVSATWSESGAGSGVPHHLIDDRTLSAATRAGLRVVTTKAHRPQLVEMDGFEMNDVLSSSPPPSDRSGPGAAALGRFDRQGGGRLAGCLRGAKAESGSTCRCRWATMSIRPRGGTPWFLRRQTHNWSTRASVTAAFSVRRIVDDMREFELPGD